MFDASHHEGAGDHFHRACGILFLNVPPPLVQKQARTSMWRPTGFKLSRICLSQAYPSLTAFAMQGVSGTRVGIKTLIVALSVFGFHCFVFVCKVYHSLIAFARHARCAGSEGYMGFGSRPPLSYSSPSGLLRSHWQEPLQDSWKTAVVKLKDSHEKFETSSFKTPSIKDLKGSSRHSSQFLCTEYF